MGDVLVDTDVFVDHLRGVAELRAGRHRLHYSVITRAELFAGTAATDIVATLLGPLRELPVDRDVAERRGASGARARSACPTPSSPLPRSSTDYSWPPAIAATSIGSAACACGHCRNRGRNGGALGRPRQPGAPYARESPPLSRQDDRGVVW